MLEDVELHLVRDLVLSGLRRALVRLNHVFVVSIYKRNKEVEAKLYCSISEGEDWRTENDDTCR